MMLDASDFFRPWEKTLNSYDEVRSFIDNEGARWSRSDRTFAWRGSVDASWPFHSSLYRRLMWSRPETTPDEMALFKKETEVLQRAQRWGLHSGERGRLSVLEQMATLQHFGAPTRLIDITFNPLIAVWFAVEESEERNDKDGRLFAVDVTNTLINDISDLRGWSAAVVHRPWDQETRHDKVDSNEWRTTTWSWRPPRFLGRIANQHGGFLFGGVPASVVAPGRRQFVVPKGPGSEAGTWRIDDVRRNTSVALRFHKIDASAGGARHDGQAAYTVRIAAHAKESIRAVLRDRYELDHATIYGDFPGFALKGTPELETRPPADRGELARTPAAEND